MLITVFFFYPFSSHDPVPVLTCPSSYIGNKWPKLGIRRYILECGIQEEHSIGRRESQSFHDGPQNRGIDSYTVMRDARSSPR
jgi:hypothetical protein